MAVRMVDEAFEPLEREEAEHRKATPADILKVMNQMAAVLTVRLMLAVAVLGALGLAGFTLFSPDAYKLGVLTIYNLMVVWPLAALSRRG